jgi:hypothetical protein
VRFQILMAASMKFRVFWDVAPCSHIEVDRRFRGHIFEFRLGHGHFLCISTLPVILFTLIISSLCGFCSELVTVHGFIC